MDPITRTCSPFLIAFALLAAPASAMTTRESGALREYVKGRVAAADDRLDIAARSLASALAKTPADSSLQRRAFVYAIAAGDRPMAVRLASQIEARDEGGLETRLTLLVDAFQRGNWKRAAGWRDRIAQDSSFGFALPVIDAWLALATRKGEPMSLLVAEPGQPLLQSYIAEHRPYMLGALGRTDEAREAYMPLLGVDSGRAIRMRLAAAAMLAKAGARDQALAMLEGEDVTLTRARVVVAAGGIPAGGVSTPAEGLGELLARIAADLGGSNASTMALTAARLSSFVAPRNAESWLIIADLLTDDGKPAAAIDALDQIRADDPFRARALSSKAALLLGEKRDDEAIALVREQAEAKGATAVDMARYADVLSDIGRYAEATPVYERALAMLPADAPRRWQMLLMLGGAHERAGQWQQAEPYLREAVKLAPDEAVALNYLGYSLLDHGGDLDEAERLIAKAHRLRPDEGSITDSYAWVYYKRGRFERAVQLLERAAASEPAEPTINEHLGDAYWQLDRKVDARFAWRAAMVGAEKEDDLARLRRKVDWGLDHAEDAAAR